MKYNAEHFTSLKDPMAPCNFQHEAQPPGHDGQNVYDLVFVFFLNFIFHIVLVNVEQPTSRCTVCYLIPLFPLTQQRTSPSFLATPHLSLTWPSVYLSLSTQKRDSFHLPLT